MVDLSDILKHLKPGVQFHMLNLRGKDQGRAPIFQITLTYNDGEGQKWSSSNSMFNVETIPEVVKRMQTNLIKKIHQERAQAEFNVKIKMTTEGHDKLAEQMAKNVETLTKFDNEFNKLRERRDKRDRENPEYNLCACWNEGQYGRVHREKCPIHAEKLPRGFKRP
jgi:hypothetical protein